MIWPERSDLSAVTPNGGLLLDTALAERMTEPRPQYVEIEFEGHAQPPHEDASRRRCLEIRFDWRHETAGCEPPGILETHRLLVLDSSTWIDRFERLPPGWTITMDPEGPIGRGLLVARFNGDGVPDSG